MSRFVLVVLGALGLLWTGCGEKHCAPGTVFVELDRSGTALGADELDIAASIDGAAPINAKADLSKAGAHATLTLEFKDHAYPTGSMVVFTFSAVDKKGGGSVLATSTLPALTLARSCERVSVTLPGGMSGPDAAVGDAAPDFAGCVATCPSTPTCGVAAETCPTSCGPPCQVLGVTPRLANTDSIIVLEGTFTQDATIDFPGAASLALTVAGDHRATAKVPDTATSGPLVVHSGHQTLDAGMFRRASFALAPHSVSAASPQTDAARQGTTLAHARKYEVLVEHGGWIYAIGGSGAAAGTSMPLSSIDRVRVNADGSSGYTDTLASTLVTPRIGAASVSIGNRLFIIGGAAGSASTDTLNSYEWATFQADGTLSAFTQVSSPFSQARSFCTAHVIGDQVVLVGGSSGMTDVSILEHATIAADGSLGMFSVVPNTGLMTGRHAHASFVTPYALVVVGGATGPGTGTATGSVEYAQIDGTGAIGLFTTSSTPLPVPAANLVGTQWGSTLFAWPYVATVDVTQGASAFTQASVAVGDAAPSKTDTRTVVARDHIYLLTSTDTSNTTYNLLLNGALTTQAQLGGFTLLPSATAALPTQLGSSGGAVIGDSVYLFGGAGTSGFTNKVYRAPIAADDTIGNFVDAGVTLPVSVGEHALLVTQSHVYVLGGVGAAGSPLATIYKANIAADGSVGAFTAAQDTSSSNLVLVAPRRGLRALAIDDVVCAMGGYGTSTSSLYQCAQLSSDGTLLTSFAPMLDYSNAPNNLVTARAYFITTYFNGTMAIYGGGGSSPVTTVEVTIPGFMGYNKAKTWANASSSISEGPLHPPAVLVGELLYILGPSLVADVINFDQAFSASSGTTLQQSVVAAAAFLIGNQVYVVGGNNSLRIEQATLK
ncbi:MAG: hypothetical protein ABI321_24950 [Polyangia bacterium]